MIALMELVYYLALGISAEEVFMQVNLHANATTTPKVRAYIQTSTAPVAELAEELGVSEPTVRKWRDRKTVQDRSHCRRRLGQSTSAQEETLICDLRRDVGLSLDDIVEVMRRCINGALSRSSIYRCLKRYGLSGRVKPPEPEKAGRFTEQGFGFVHIDLKHLTQLRGKKAYVFVAIERTTRFVHIEIVHDRRALTIATCLEGFLKAFAYPVHTILTDNGSEFTDRFAVDMKGKPEDAPSGGHPFDRICMANGIEHRLTRPFHPQTNGMVERFNRRLSEILRNAPIANRNNGKNRFDNHEARNQFIHNFVNAYNHTRLKCLDYHAPLEMLNNQTKDNT
jgi:transposase